MVHNRDMDSTVRSKNRRSNMTTFTFQAVTLNNVKGWIATRRIDGVFAGKQFGKTQKAAREAFYAS